MLKRRQKIIFFMLKKKLFLQTFSNRKRFKYKMFLLICK